MAEILQISVSSAPYKFSTR